MFYRTSIGTFAIAAALILAMDAGQAVNGAEYPDWRGQWARILVPGLAGQTVKFDPSKPWGPGQGAPLTP